MEKDTGKVREKSENFVSPEKREPYKRNVCLVGPGCAENWNVLHVSKLVNLHTDKSVLTHSHVSMFSHVL